MLYLLDTDHLSLLERGGAAGSAIRERLCILSPDDYGISIVTYTEQVKGWLAEVARANTVEREVRAFEEMQCSLNFCMTFAIWKYGPKSATQCEELKKLKLRVGTQDLRIASIALVNQATLLTRNIRDFSRVPGLSYEDWTI